MTNVEIRLKAAVKALENGNLNENESAFIEDIRDYDKKQLRGTFSQAVQVARRHS
jgi:hypothetical protein